MALPKGNSAHFKLVPEILRPCNRRAMYFITQNKLMDVKTLLFSLLCVIGLIIVVVRSYNYYKENPQEFKSTMREVIIGLIVMAVTLAFSAGLAYIITEYGDKKVF